ncbi:O-antigen ligase family protein [Marinobacter sp. S0848L]|uniref:O-antigen ligase family protein n=1 Tax=Marinobacter sp. S0848L TaxID=2926423 RepID=UPI001FF1CDF2|nr:O-antigen ligase family protein [Marinobacter sp. S0848L]MCK0107316.1 O-antigen ligase family protein [Marinobacter sp. S0848L]
MRIGTFFSVRLFFLLSGALIAIFYAHPAPPFYLFVFFVISLCFLVNLSKIKVDVVLLFLIFILVSVSILSVIVNSSGVHQGLVPVVGVVLGYFLFLSGAFLTFNEYFWRGFSVSSLVLSFLILFFYFFSGSTSFGFGVFYIPEFRMWGDEYFSDWPNYIGFPLVISLFLRRIRLIKFGMIDVMIVSAILLTTSRVLMFGVFLVLMLYVLFEKKSLLFFVVVSCFLAIFYLDLEPFFDRLTKFNDRSHLYSGLVEGWLVNPLLGWGGVKVSDVFPETYYDSYHNSYLEVLVKSGVVGFGIYVALILYLALSPYFKGRPLFHKQELYFLACLMFVIAASFFQNYLKHPHVIFIFSALCHSGVKGVVGRNEKKL